MRTQAHWLVWSCCSLISSKTRTFGSVACVCIELTLCRSSAPSSDATAWLSALSTLTFAFEYDSLCVILQGLQLQQSYSTLDTADKLLKVRPFLCVGLSVDCCQVVTSVFSTSEDDKRATVKAYVQALNQSLPEKRNVIFILESLCNIIKPPKPQRHCQVILRKVIALSMNLDPFIWLLLQSKLQEDFIRGSMKKNPYHTTDFDGPLMLHIKKKICRFVV